MEYRTLDERFENRIRISNPFVTGYEYEVLVFWN